MKRVLLAWSILSSLLAMGLVGMAIADGFEDKIPIPVPRCWVTNCRTYCNGSDCVACVMSDCGDDSLDAFEWCAQKFEPTPCDKVTRL